MTWLKWMAVAATALLAGLALLTAFGAWRWNAGTRALVERLDAARRPLQPARYDAARDLDGLPRPVQRFFEAALADGSPLVATVSLAHRGTFNLAADGPDRWIPFTSTQRVTTGRPGFVWDARMAMAPGLAVRVHDAYVAGEGVLHPAVLGLFSLTDLRGASPEPGGVAHGEFMRFVAEAAWYPTALLPRQGARWTAVDEHAARVGPCGWRPSTSSLLIRFDPGHRSDRLGAGRGAWPHRRAGRRDDTLGGALVGLRAARRLESADAWRGGLVDARRQALVLARPGYRAGVRIRALIGVRHVLQKRASMQCQRSRKLALVTTPIPGRRQRAAGRGPNPFRGRSREP